ncbi:MAG: RHS repeat-associated core domain-containing protein [Acidobacteria bacterium]|nr:RHS repeat-associated core domain-containing protein [Acidobacteriota bacterium]
MIVAEGSKVQWTLADHLGTPRMVVDKSGRLFDDPATTTYDERLVRHDYLPFGEELLVGMGNSSIRSAGMGYVIDAVRQKFTGYERDSESGLDYAGARYYGSIMGRFTSPDNFLNDTHTADPSSWNLYTYARNNPLRYVDPTGELIRLVNIEGTNRDELLKMLNDNYGCSGCVTVDKSGYLQVDTSTVSKDVLAKAQFLTDAITDKNYLAFAVGYEGHANINFAKAAREALEVGGKRYDAIMIDFKDFKAVSGDREAVRSFTNYAFAHELAHLYPKPGLEDTVSSKDPTGPTENRINELRHARGALLRATYSATQDSENFGSQWFGPAKVNKKTGQIERNVNGGIVVESKKLVNWNLRMTGTVR